MQRIKVARVESKPTAKGGTMVALYDDKDTRFSGFIKELLDVKQGDTVEAEIEIDGKYNNIKSVKVVEHAAAGTQLPDTTSALRYAKPDNSASIEAQTAAKIAGELLVAGVVKLTDPLGKAVVTWCGRRLVQTMPPAKTATATPTTANAEWENL